MLVCSAVVIEITRGKLETGFCMNMSDFADSVSPRPAEL